MNGKTKSKWRKKSIKKKPVKGQASKNAGSVYAKTTRTKSYKNTYGGLGVAGNPSSQFLSLTTKTVNPFPTKWTVNLTYGINQVITNLGGDNKWRSVQYNFTNVYDPDVSNGSRNGQPYGFDQISPFFNRYVVKAVKYDVIFSHPGTNNQTLVPGCFAMVAIRNETDYMGYMHGRNLEYPLERTGNTVKLISADNYHVRFKGNVIPYNVLGATSWDNYLETSSALTTGGPTVGDNVLCEFSVCEASAYTYDKFTRLIGTLTYTVEFYDPVGQAQS